MIIAREYDGKVFVSKVAKTAGSDTAGSLEGWYFIGPGLRPTITEYGPNTYMVLFDYMGVLTARLLDAAEWPPRQVDPISYNTGWNIQRGEDAIPFSVFSTNAAGVKCENVQEPGSAVLVSGALYYDAETDTFTTTISRDTATNPSPATRTGWRTYWRITGTQEWILLQDWTTEVTNLQIQSVQALKREICMTWGHLWDPAVPNDNTRKLESPKGPILRLDSDVMPKTTVATVSQTGTVARGVSTNAYTHMEPGQRFFNRAETEQPVRSIARGGGPQCNAWGNHPAWGGADFGRPYAYALPTLSATVSLLSRADATNCNASGRPDNR